MSEHRRIVLITGAARGIGYAIAEAFAQQGDQPVMLDLEVKGVEEAAQRLAKEYNCEAYGAYVDVSDAKSVEDAVGLVIQELGRIDVVVNNAGLQHVDAVEDFPVEQWDRLIGVMLKGPFLLTKYVVPHMKKQKNGRIINISSVHGKTASPYKAAYVSAKHGLVGLTRTVAIETADFNITCNAVLPGVVQTVLIENQLQKLADADRTTKEEALQKHLLFKQAVKRFIKPEEVAAACIYLASEGAASVTGECISVSGGW